MKVTRFAGSYAFLSNFFPVQVRWVGETYPSVEHAYQAAKTKSPKWKRKIREAKTPGLAKRYGQKAPLRKDWDEVRLRVMEELVRRKFTENVELRRALLKTGNMRLVEGNTWGDRFWGKVVVGTKLVGKNHLGKILMKIRDELRDEFDLPPRASFD